VLHMRPQHRTLSIDSFSQGIVQLAEKASRGSFLRRGAHLASDPAISNNARDQKTVLLVHPPGACSAFTRSGSQYPPLGLLQLKATIDNPNRVDVLEADGSMLTDLDTAEQIFKHAPLAIGMTVTCGTKVLVHAWSTVVKNLTENYNPIVIVGERVILFCSTLRII
jgi:hypothetical protein